ncbi:hypothetical protein BH18THE2_BH18THE2_16120 [soil metagenome]
MEVVPAVPASDFDGTHSWMNIQSHITHLVIRGSRDKSFYSTAGHTPAFSV